MEAVIANHLSPKHLCSVLEKITKKYKSYKTSNSSFWKCVYNSSNLPYQYSKNFDGAERRSNERK